MQPVDLEAALVTLMAPLGVPVRTKVPNPRPASFVRVSRAGGFRANLVQERATLLVECWAANEPAAADLASRAYAALDVQGMDAGSAWISSANLSSPVNFPDPETASARYQLTAQLLVNLKEPA